MVKPGEVIKVGDDVHYYSSSYDEWMTGKVLAINPDGSFELDIKSGAHPALVIKNPTPEDLKTKPSRPVEIEVTAIPPLPPLIRPEDLPPEVRVGFRGFEADGIHH